ncbi:hypothetical protein [Actinoplanes sp. NPDC049265]|uniref:hypothetical protein n=1 Tax=Actinoplanes sp. NPDC049265 TaxID=3363902 RepID=UPI0037167C06
MNDLKQLDPALNREPSPAEWSRSRAALERIMAEPGRRPLPVRRWAVGVTVVAAAAVAGVLAVPALLPSAADQAVASWTPAPGTLSGADVLPQAKSCAKAGILGFDPDTLTSADVLLADQRGAATSLILRRGEKLVECMLVGGDDAFATMGLADGPLPPVGPEHATIETQSSVGEGDGQYSQIAGRVDESVTGIDLVLEDGMTIRTSSKEGWWTAWWPGPAGGQVDKFLINVHTAAGTKSYRQSQL